MTDQEIIDRASALLAYWRPVFGLSDMDIELKVEDVPAGIQHALAASIISDGVVRARIVIATNIEEMLIREGLTFEHVVVHELAHIAIDASGFGEIRHAARQALAMLELPDHAIEIIARMFNDSNEQITHKMEVALVRARNLGRLDASMREE